MYLVADDDEVAVATHADAAAATTHVAVPCLGVPAEAGRYAFLGVGGGSVAQHFCEDFVFFLICE